ncbi:MAG TPA: hypothetical protein VFB02_13720 [Bradyrhizobium sp.]|nr:hypothetical protein [Bradyrhizobium sp.]
MSDTVTLTLSAIEAEGLAALAREGHAVLDLPGAGLLKGLTTPSRRRAAVSAFRRLQDALTPTKEACA